MNRKQAVAAAQLAFPGREVSGRATYGGPVPRFTLYARAPFAGILSFSYIVGEGMTWDRAVFDMQHRPHRFPMAKPLGDA